MKIGIKGFIFGVVTAIFLIGTPVFADDLVKTIQVKFNEITLEVNGDKVDADNILYNGTTYVPFRTVATLLNKDVEYISSTVTASITDKNYAKKNYEIDLIEKDCNRVKSDVEGIADLSDSIVKINAIDYNGNYKSGSGVFISNDGYILTNYHVISNSFSFEVFATEDGEPNTFVELIYFDPEVDLALLKINTQSKGLYITPKKPDVGSDAVVIGSPLGIFNTVSEGIISGFTVESGIDSILTSAPISSGNSGGALMNMYGEVVGIIYATYEEGENLNLAISSNVVLDFLKQAEYSNKKILTYSDGWYIGETKNGKRHGIGDMYWNNGTYYYGYFFNDTFYDGYGVYQYENGDFYYGYLVDGIPDGLGSIMFSADNYIHYYIGDFVTEEEIGIGTYIFPEYGELYTGYVDNKYFEGYGYYGYSDDYYTFANWSSDYKIGNFVGINSDGEMCVYRVVNDEWVKVK